MAVSHRLLSSLAGKLNIPAQTFTDILTKYQMYHNKFPVLVQYNNYCASPIMNDLNVSLHPQPQEIVSLHGQD